MTALQFFGYLSAIIGTIASFPYIRDILKGKTKPERASWFIWTVLGTIAFFSQLEKGATNSLWLVGVGTLSVLVVSILSIKFGSGGLARRDIFSLIFAVLGILLWFFTKDSTIALIITILVGSTGSFLTVVKSYEDPESETISTWLLVSVAGIFSALSVGRWNLILLIYPTYIFLTNIAVVSAILLGKNRKEYPIA